MQRDVIQCFNVRRVLYNVPDFIPDQEVSGDLESEISLTKITMMKWTCP
jgi:hypothetical protein